MKLPKIKTENIVVQDLQAELLVYNLTTHQAFTLNDTLKIVYNACDGNASSADLKRSFKFTDDLIHLALAELSANNLLEGYEDDYFKGLSRREAIKKVGLTSLIALPVIASIVAPQSAQAISACPSGQTRCGGTCTNMNSDARNCGGCGQVCPANTVCSNGRCCTQGLTSCNGACTNLQTDRNNCGACGNECATGRNCQNGACG